MFLELLWVEKNTTIGKRKATYMAEDIVKIATIEMTRLENILKEIDIFLDKAPKGCLKWQQKDSKIYYYHQYAIKDTVTDNHQKIKMEGYYYKREYIKKTSSLAETLAQKQYYQVVKPVVEKNVLELRKFITSYQQNEINDIYDTLSDERKKLVKPLQISANEKIKKWAEETYEKCNIYPENLRYETEQGELVRSKSEVIIANILYKHHKEILYKYECPLTLMIDGKAKIIYPDFTIINVKTGKVVYWEHAGKMDDAHYASEFVKKMNGYVSNGFLIGRDVILTFETQGNPLDIGVVKKLVKNILE